MYAVLKNLRTNSTKYPSQLFPESLFLTPPFPRAHWNLWSPPNLNCMIGFLQHTTHTSFHNTSKLHLHPGNNLDTLSTSYGFPHQSSIDSNPCSLLLNIHIASYISVGSLNTSKLHLGNLDPLFHIVWFSPPVFHRLKFLLLPTQHPRHIASHISVGSAASSAFCPSPLINPQFQVILPFLRCCGPCLPDSSQNLTMRTSFS